MHRNSNYAVNRLNNRHIKKAWSPTVVVPRFRGLRIACILNRQREAHADMHAYARIPKLRYERIGYTHPEDIYRC